MSLEGDYFRDNSRTGRSTNLISSLYSSKVKFFHDQPILFIGDVYFESQNLNSKTNSNLSKWTNGIRRGHVASHASLKSVTPYLSQNPLKCKCDTWLLKILLNKSIW